MRILVAYDGSHDANVAIADLGRASLPPESQILVATVGDYESEGIDFDVTVLRRVGGITITQADEIAQHGAGFIRALMPAASVDAASLLGEPADALIDRAQVWQADLVVVGSTGHSAVGRLLLGSVSAKVAAEATCSVRIGRIAVVDRTHKHGFHIATEPRSDRHVPTQIVVGFDRSRYAQAAVDSIAHRSWPEGTRVRLVTALETSYTQAGVDEQHHELAPFHADAASRLRERGIAVDTLITDGNPTKSILREATKLNADVIFVGSHGVSGFKRLVLGSVSSNVANQAQCSVEIVRVRDANE